MNTKKTQSKGAKPQLLLFDGHSMAYRAFYGMPDDMRTRSGQLTNMLVGFLGGFFKHYKECMPDKVAVCFDLPKPTFRHKAYKEYKANRPPAPKDFLQQLKLLHEILEALGVCMVAAAGYEADDLLATLAKLGESQKHKVHIVTGDRDCFQLVRDSAVDIIYTPTKGEPVVMDEAGVKNKIGVLPKDYLSYAALKGDSSDNLPGVPKVGEKTAVMLIENFQDISGIYKVLESDEGSELIKPAVKKSLTENREIAERNMKLMKLDEKVSLDVKLSSLKLGRFSEDKVAKLFSELELTKFDEPLKELWGVEYQSQAKYASMDALLVSMETESSKELAAHLKSVKGGTKVSVAGNWEDTGRFSGLGLAVKKGAKYEALWIPAGWLAEKPVADALKVLLSKKSAASAKVIAHNVKPLILELLDFEIDISNLAFDTSIAAYLNPEDVRTDLEDLVVKYASLQIGGKEEGAEEQKEKDTQMQLGEADQKGSALQEAAGLLMIEEKMATELKKINATEIYETMEIPLVRVLADMEKAGIAVDKKELQMLAGKLERASKKKREAVLAAAGKGKGEEFNVNSTQELSKVLFEELGLTPVKKTKTGFSTDAATLEKLLGHHPVVECIMEYREVEKLRSTYGAGLLKAVQKDGRIHASFSQTVARTGRLSSDAPNLHNIPVRTELGREFRKVFWAQSGCEFLIADYNQIELRCVAHLSGDPNLKKAFQEGMDVHANVAERVFNVETASSQQREYAKMVSYGLIYGMEAYGLSQRLNIEQAEAKVILDSFFDSYPKVREHMDKSVETAKKLGYTETLFGRRRYIPELKSELFQVRAAAVRQAMNSGIQGLAADIFKYALIGIHSRLQKKPSQARLILQVHDEVILEVPKSEKEVTADMVLKEMEGAAKLDVPLAVDLSFGKTWADAKS